VIILSQIRVLVTEIVEIFHKFVKYLLFAVQSLKEFDILGLNLVKVLFNVLSLQLLLAKYSFHLSFVVCRYRVPEGKEDSLEIFLDVVSLR